MKLVIHETFIKKYLLFSDIFYICLYYFIGGKNMSVEGIESSYYSKIKQRESVSQRNKLKNEQLASFDSNKKYQSLDTMTNDLLLMEKKWQVQYGEIVSNSKVSTIDELKEEISALFPEYQFVTRKPDEVMDGQNLLYIDNINLNKMLNDSSYRAKIYALMKRELACTKGYHLYNSAWRLTGTVFTLSEDNPKELGIPYAGQCRGIQLNDSYTFLKTTSKKHIFCDEKNHSKIKDRKAKMEKNKKLKENETKILWEKERQEILMEQIEEKVANTKARNKKIYHETALKKYQQTYDKYMQYIEE